MAKAKKGGGFRLPQLPKIPDGWLPVVVLGGVGLGLLGLNALLQPSVYVGEGPLLSGGNEEAVANAPPSIPAEKERDAVVYPTSVPPYDLVRVTVDRPGIKNAEGAARAIAESDILRALRARGYVMRIDRRPIQGLSMDGSGWSQVSNPFESADRGTLNLQVIDAGPRAAVARTLGPGLTAASSAPLPAPGTPAWTPLDRDGAIQLKTDAFLVVAVREGSFDGVRDELTRMFAALGWRVEVFDENVPSGSPNLFFKLVRVLGPEGLTRPVPMRLSSSREIVRAR